MTADYLTTSGFEATHGFFTRRGGVSHGPYASLNCSLSGGDDPALVARNRALVAEAMRPTGDRPVSLVGVTQVHGCEVAEVAKPWPPGAGPRADAMVTRHPAVALGIITADCAPVLLWDGYNNIAGAAHAGWRGAAAGVLEATVAAMQRLGSDLAHIQGAIGPCIAQASYEIGDDLRGEVLRATPEADVLFLPGNRPGHWQFDLAGYCTVRLAASGVRNCRTMGLDTCADETRFFSHRRRTLGANGPIGHQISVIRTHG